jgi:hypothetical protein
VEVEGNLEVIKQLEGYNMKLIGGPLILSKLEETAKVHSLVDLYGNSMTKNKMEDIAKAFDTRMNEVIMKWRLYLGEGNDPFWLHVKSEDAMINKLMDDVDRAVMALEAHEVDITPKKKSKRKIEEEDDHSPETKWQFERVDMEVEASLGRRSGRCSPHLHPH